MRLLKPLLLGLTGLSIVILLISSLLPNHVMTSKWVRVHASKDSILAEVRNLEGWKEWNGLLMGASDIHVSDSTMTWVSSGGDKKNTVTIKGSTSMGLSTEISLHEGKPFNSGFSIEKRDPSMDSVQVVWFIVEELKWYPWEKFYGIFVDKLTGAGYEQALNGLKDYLEAGR